MHQFDAPAAIAGGFYGCDDSWCHKCHAVVGDDVSFDCHVSKGIYLMSLCYSCYSRPLIFRSQPSRSFTSPSGFMVVNNPKNDKAVNNPNKPAGTTSNMNPSIQVLCSWLRFSALGSPHWHLLSPRCSRCGPSSF